jgi:TRAP-type C4-dicarboxylate transport system permease small subunit
MEPEPASPAQPARGSGFLAKASRAVRYSCWGFLVVLNIVMTIQIVLRTFTNLPVAWTDELLKLFFTWFGMLAAVTAFWDNSHIAIEFFVNLLPARLKTAVVAMEKILTLGILLLILPSAWELFIESHNQETVVLGLPMSFSYAAFPVAFGLLAASYVMDIFRRIRQGVAP